MKSSVKRPKSKPKMPYQAMSGAALKEFRERRKWSREDLGELIGLSVGSIRNYENEGRDDGRPAPIPKLVRLALAALAGGILEYDGVAAVGPPGFVAVEDLKLPNMPLDFGPFCSGAGLAGEDAAE